MRKTTGGPYRSPRETRTPDWMRGQRRRRRIEALRRKARLCGRCVTIGLFLYILIHAISGEAIHQADSESVGVSAALLAPDVNADIGPAPSPVMARHLPDAREGNDPPKWNIQRRGIADLLDDRVFMNLEEPVFNFTANGRALRVETTIDADLQRRILENLNRDHARYIGLVMLQPETGRVLAMVGHDRTDPNANPCVAGRFPAASIFKIVTAAAAVEECGLESDSIIEYRGRKYTLYKSQLRADAGRGAHSMSLRDSFAQSVNPVFGKLGIHYLGQAALRTHAEAFGFNQTLPFEIPVSPSNLTVTEIPYQWAEIASGFNRETTLSPLHAAVIAASVCNGGYLMTPILVDRIVDQEGRAVYESLRRPLGRAMTDRAARTLRTLMRETIDTGTCRKTFRNYRKDSVLSRLEIGGKTGSINSHAGPDRRIDWFVGFAADRQGRDEIAVAALVVHEKYIGTKAREYALMMMRAYFDAGFSGRSSKEKKELG